MNALDLFCCAGGITRGLQLAGFEVTGVDRVDQPNYCGDHFHKGDALEYSVDGFDVVFASPPCQRHSAAAEIHDSAQNHPDLVPATRARLVASGLPYVIENVERAPLRNPVVLCGSMFGLGVRRRLFESNVCLLVPTCGDHSHWYASVFGGRCLGRQRVTGAKSGSGERTQTWDRFDDELATARVAMDIDWMDLAELSQAIPPAYGAFLGEQMMQAIRGSDLEAVAVPQEQL